MRKSKLLALLLLLNIPATADASWLSDITGIDVNVPAGKISINTPRPQDIPQMIQHLPDDVRQALNPAGTALATAIRVSSAQANHGSQVIPSTIAAILAPYFPANILAKARWNTLQNSGIDIVGQLAMLNRDVAAITLDNVIVFRDANDAQTNWKLWAHELVHVTQYENMGVEKFADVYSLSGGSGLENQAYSWEDHVYQDVMSKQNSVNNAAISPVGYTFSNQSEAIPDGAYACDQLAAHPSDPWHTAPGVPYDQLNGQAAVSACAVAVQVSPQEPRYYFQLGRAYDRLGQYGTAFQYYYQAAKMGYAAAHINVGDMYQHGIYVQQNLQTAAMWYQSAYYLGDQAAAQQALNSLLSTSNNVYPHFCCTMAGRFGPYPNAGYPAGAACYAQPSVGQIFTGVGCY